MAQTLRLYQGGQNPSLDWHDRGIISTAEIERIQDPADGSLKEITSIPSPFARIHLFENAFNYVTKKAIGNYKSLDDRDMYHQLVSDALDVAELFFLFDELKDSHDLKIICWNRHQEIEKLKNGNQKHQLVAKTLELFIKQDGSKTNFDSMDNFYVLTCKSEIIGGTSPTTLFFCAYNENQILSRFNFKISNDTFFDAIPNPLYKRSEEFQRYLYGLFQCNPELRNKMKGIYDFLEQNLEALRQTDHSKYLKLLQIRRDDYTVDTFNNDFNDSIFDGPNSFMSVLNGIYQRRLKPKALNGPFCIKPERVIEGPVPFALESTFSKPMEYAGGNWTPNTRVPFYDSAEFSKRQLPGVARTHPYLTASDLFEPYLIRLPFPIDQGSFIFGKNNLRASTYRANGKVELPGNNGYLLPLTNRFFDFYTTDYLNKTLPSGQGVFNVQYTSDGSFNVQLWLEIQSGDFILYERNYKANSNPNIDGANNEGAIKDLKIDIAFFPFSYLLIDGNKIVDQDVILLDGDQQTSRICDLKFFDENNRAVTPQKITSRHKKQDNNREEVVFHKLKQFYQCARLVCGDVSGVIIPKWNQKANGTSVAKIAVDFGTTNSFMAVKIDGKKEEIEINYGARLLRTLSDNVDHSNGLKDSIFRTFMGYTIGKNGEINLRTRTAITEPEGLNPLNAEIVSQIGIPFLMNQRLPYAKEKIYTNLKWGGLQGVHGQQNTNRIKAFLHIYLSIAKNYLLEKGADMQNIEIVWTYPESMTRNNVGNFSTIWNTIANSIFSKPKISQMSEALAPYYSWTATELRNGQYPVLNIDIGGGTTDVIIFENGLPTYSTSFRFAGNAIFGSGYDESPYSQNNGILNKFKPVFEQWFNSNQNAYNLNELYSGTNGVSNLGAADINAFLFSIEENPEVLEMGIRPLSYSSLLREDEQVKTVLLYFYCAIAYHLARLMNKLELPMPRQITLSGRGAAVVDILDPTMNQSSLTLLTKKIFEKVYSNSYHTDGLDFLKRPNSKERTCLGALEFPPLTPDYTNVVYITNSTLQKFKNSQPIGENITYGNLINNRQLINELTEEIREFNSFFLKIGEEINFHNCFGALPNNQLRQLDTVLNKDCHGNILNGLNVNDSAEAVTDALFFYPLVGAITQLMDFFSHR